MPQPRSRRLVSAVAAALLLAALVPLQSTLGASSNGGGSAHGGASSAVKRIFVIMLENHSQSTVIGDVNAPFISGLASTYGEATNYYGVTHPSQPNYVAAITGQLDITRMNDSATNTYDWTNLVDQLEAHGRTWGAYMEALPYAGYTGAIYPDAVTLPPLGAALYTNKHDPFVLMDDIRNDPARLADIKPYTDLAADLNSPHAPDFIWISPDQCNDMHGGVVAVAGHPETPCPYGGTIDDANDASLKAKADAFVEGAVDTITSSKAWTGNSVIMILTDEADFSSAAVDTDEWLDVSGCCDSPGYGITPGLPDGYILVDNGSHPWSGPFGGGKVPAIVVTRNGPRGIVDATPYNHYSLLRTIEDVWHLGYLGYAADEANVQSMTTLFRH